MRFCNVMHTPRTKNNHSQDRLLQRSRDYAIFRENVQIQKYSFKIAIKLSSLLI